MKSREVAGTLMVRPDRSRARSDRDKRRSAVRIPAPPAGLRCPNPRLVARSGPRTVSGRAGTPRLAVPDPLVPRLSGRRPARPTANRRQARSTIESLRASAYGVPVRSASILAHRTRRFQPASPPLSCRIASSRIRCARWPYFRAEFENVRWCACLAFCWLGQVPRSSLSRWTPWSPPPRAPSSPALGALKRVGVRNDTPCVPPASDPLSCSWPARAQQEDLRSSPREPAAPGSQRRARRTRKIWTCGPIKDCGQTEPAPAIAIQRQGKRRSDPRLTLRQPCSRWSLDVPWLEVHFKSQHTPLRARHPLHRAVARSSARRWTVERLRFGQLPMLVRVVVGLSLLNAWVSFEEFVVDRSDLWKYMPDYKVGRFCVWDLSVIALIIAGLVWASVEEVADQNRRKQRAALANHRRWVCNAARESLRRCREASCKP